MAIGNRTPVVDQSSKPGEQTEGVAAQYPATAELPADRAKRPPAPGHRFAWLYPFDYPLLVYTLVALGCSYKYGFRFNWAVIVDFGFDKYLLTAGIPLMLMAWTVRQIRRQRAHPGGLDLLGREFLAALRKVWNWHSWYEVLRTVLAVKLCLAVYSHLKQEIPVLNPVLYDQQLWLVDRIVHLGISPVHASLCLSTPLLDRAIDLLYALWYFALIPFFLYFTLLAPRAARHHFFTSYLLIHMIGGSFAILWPSLGPVYVRPELYTGLNAPVAEWLQGLLWQHYQALLADPAAYRVFVYSGIAAFPSLHVAAIVLMTIAVRDHRWLFRPMLAYCLAIQFGSVFLGWHYAIDGYFGVVLVLAVFYGTRRWIPAFRPPSR